MGVQGIFLVALILIHSVANWVPTQYKDLIPRNTPFGESAHVTAIPLFLSSPGAIEHSLVHSVKRPRLSIEHDYTGRRLRMYISRLIDAWLELLQFGVEWATIMGNKAKTRLWAPLSLENLQGILWVVAIFKLGVILLLLLNYYEEYKTSRSRNQAAQCNRIK